MEWNNLLVINKKIYEYFYHATIDCDLVSFFIVSSISSIYSLRKNFDFILSIIEESKCYTRRQKDNTFCIFYLLSFVSENMREICMEIQSFLCIHLVKQAF